MAALLGGAASGAAAQADGSLIFPRKMVVEEWTGTWCGMCVSGIVGMQYMEENYGDENFIGLAVHSNDMMQAATYKDFIDNFIVTSFPGSVINRTHVADPRPESLEYSYSRYGHELTFAKVAVSAVAPSTEDEEMEVAAMVRFSKDFPDAEFMLTFVLSEDEVGPYSQYNTYSSGILGEMGGWEKMRSVVSTRFNHVVREAVDCLGITGSIPSQVEADTDYTYSTAISLSNIKNINNATLVALLIDGESREIVNADKMKLAAAGVDGVGRRMEPVIAVTHTGLRFEGDITGGTIHTLDGRCVAVLGEATAEISLPSGLYIVTVKGGDGSITTRKILI